VGQPSVKLSVEGPIKDSDPALEQPTYLPESLYSSYRSQMSRTQLLMKEGTLESLWRTELAAEGCARPACIAGERK
jgi:hypothetical protein